jgi:hypothetical protein
VNLIGEQKMVLSSGRSARHGVVLWADKVGGNARSRRQALPQFVSRNAVRRAHVIDTANMTICEQADQNCGERSRINRISYLSRGKGDRFVNFPPLDQCVQHRIRTAFPRKPQHESKTGYNR